MKAAPSGVDEIEFEYLPQVVEGVHPVVEDGHPVATDDLLATGSNQTCHHVDLTSIVSVSGPDVIDQLYVAIGDQVGKGDVLAVSTAGIRKKELLSPVDGIVSAVTETAVLKIESGIDQEVRSPFAGKIRLEGQKIKVVFPGLSLMADWGSGEPFAGPVCLAQPGDEDVFCFQMNDCGSIVICPQLISRAAFYKAMSLGVGGLVVIAAPADVELQFSKVSASRSTPLGVLAIDPSREEVVAFLKDNAGVQAYLDPKEKKLVLAHKT